MQYSILSKTNLFTTFVIKMLQSDYQVRLVKKNGPFVSNDNTTTGYTATDIKKHFDPQMTEWKTVLYLFLCSGSRNF